MYFAVCQTYQSTTYLQIYLTSRDFIAPSQRRVYEIQASINFNNYSARQTNFLRIAEKVLLYSLLKQCRQKGQLC